MRTWFRLINPEWFREPPSKLEATLRTPHILKHAFVLFLRRVGPRWLMLSVAIWFVFNNAIFSILAGFLVFLVIELFTLRRYYEMQAVPKHIRNIKRIKKSSVEIDGVAIKQLVKIIDDSVRLSSWGLVNIGYVGLSAWGWEIIFKAVYPLVTKSDVPYQSLLVGFKNKVTDSDQALWEIAQEKDEKKREKALEKYLSEYGSKVDDLEISKPTLREQPKVVKKLLELYKKTTSPLVILEKQKGKRIESTKTTVDSLRISKSIFFRFLKRVQENVALREDRRHYHFIADFYIRRMLLRLAKQLGISEAQIFSMSWKDIRVRANKK